MSQPNSGNFGPADNFPGIGSPVGGILPGIVLTTTVLPATALNLPQTVPILFTTAPTYLPDAPFVNRLYGESSFNNMVFGAKIRFTGPNNPLGVGLIPFYRWWMDKADDFSGFNQMQRGAGPGGDIGDFGLIGFVDGRLGKHVNVSANVGYILNSNPKGLDGDFVLLDRPDEFLAGIGFDFPINEHFQPIAEVRSTTYVGGHTPNAFGNNPVDVLGGIKIYPRRWFGIGLAYRRHLNPQDMDHFNPVDFTIPIQSGHERKRDWKRLGGCPWYVKTGDFARLPGWIHILRGAEWLYRAVLDWTSQRQDRRRPPNQPPTVSFRNAVDGFSAAALPAADQFDNLYADWQRGNAGRQCYRPGQRSVALYLVSNRWTAQW